MEWNEMEVVSSDSGRNGKKKDAGAGAAAARTRSWRLRDDQHRFRNFRRWFRLER